MSRYWITVPLVWLAIAVEAYVLGWLTAALIAPPVVALWVGLAIAFALGLVFLHIAARHGWWPEDWWFEPPQESTIHEVTTREENDALRNGPAGDVQHSDHHSEGLP
jgi:hypothetical protein